jgi:hypothetical protein
MNKKIKLSITAIFLVSALVFIPKIVFSQSFSNMTVSLWNFTSNTLVANGTNWKLKIPQLGGSGTKCLQVDNTGLFSTSSAACGSGSGGSGTISTSTTPIVGQLAQWTGLSTLGTIATSSLNLLSTDILEGSKLFYTDSRVGSYITGSSTLPALLNYWTKSGTSLSYVAGNVGIGTTEPGNALHVLTADSPVSGTTGGISVIGGTGLQVVGQGGVGGSGGGGEGGSGSI